MFTFEPNSYSFNNKGKNMSSIPDDTMLNDFDGYIEETGETANTDKVKTITDNFRKDTAFKLGVIGVGQCGNNLAQTFHRIGYRRILLINTARTDLDSIEDQIPKLPIDKQGAGKDPQIGRDRVLAKATQIRNAVLREFGEDFEKIVVCVGLGGGTGSGGGPKVIEIASDIVRSRGGDPAKDVIAIVTLPDPAIDGPRQCFNALEAYGKIANLKVPLIIVDNSAVSSIIHSKLSDGWTIINMWIAKTFHMFNVYANRQSKLGAFDGNDLNDIISRGHLLFSAFRVTKLKDRYAISDVMSKNLERSLFARCDLSTATAAGCIMIVNPRVQGELTMSDIAPAFQELNNIMRPNSTLHRGIYFPEWTDAEQNENPDLFCYVMLSGLDHPKKTLENVFEKARNYNQAYGSVSAFLTPDA
jgi:cell division GTPase FtsZ